MSPAASTLLSSAADLEVLRSILDCIDSPILLKDSRHKFVLVNKAASALLGRAYDDIVGRTDHELLPPDQADIYVANDRRVLATGEPHSNEELLTDSTGRRRTLITRKSQLRLANGQAFVLALISDVTEFRGAEVQVRHSAGQDELTQLLNNASLHDQLNSILERQKDSTLKTAVLVFDLDRFGMLNQAFGRTVGDNLLVQFSQLLLRLSGPSDLVGRLGGDEFLIAQTTATQPGDAATLASAILQRLESAIPLETTQVRISSSIGIALAGTDEGVDSLIRRAELALGQAKRGGRNQLCFFEPEMARRAAARPFLEDDLRLAQQRGQFTIAYQPYARVDDMELLGYEALLRWQHPHLGEIGPANFIPLAETEGLIAAIGEWVLREACRQAASWPNDLSVAVNVSPIQFTRIDLVSRVRSIVRDTGIAAERLVLEITETAVIGDIERARQILVELQAIGARVALDDFGAGYSSLEVLQALPFNKIKVDRSLLRGIGQSHKADVILCAILRLTKTLRLHTVAEGVETLQQLDLLRREGCEAFQGFFLSPPLTNPFENS